jgi:hypothetical protein
MSQAAALLRHASTATGVASREVSPISGDGDGFKISKANLGWLNAVSTRAVIGRVRDR